MCEIFVSIDISSVEVWIVQYMAKENLIIESFPMRITIFDRQKHVLSSHVQGMPLFLLQATLIHLNIEWLMDLFQLIRC